MNNTSNTHPSAIVIMSGSILEYWTTSIPMRLVRQSLHVPLFANDWLLLNSAMKLLPVVGIASNVK
jgi:hypothetical protein